MIDIVIEKLTIDSRRERRLGGRLPVTKSLRGKGWLFTVALGMYFIFVSLVVAYERQTMLESMAMLLNINEREERLVALNYAVSRTVIAVNENYFSPDVASSGKILALEVEALIPGLTRLQVPYPMLSGAKEGLGKAVEELASTPTRATVADLRGAMHRLVLELDLVTADVSAQKIKMVERYKNTFERLTMEWIIFGVLAFVLMALVFKLFFRGLAVDIDRVRRHASNIVHDRESSKLIHKRQDELGLLMNSINTMQDELAKRDNQIELSRQQSFHKEKMAAVGSLAAAVAHEINNPLSAIVGIAEAMDEECRTSKCEQYNNACHPEMILGQAKRVMQITRQISEFSVPQSQSPELIDLNGLLQSTVNFVKFDRRFRQVAVSVVLDANLPAILATADHLVQVAMNLLINAADALEQNASLPPSIRVVSSRQAGSVMFQVIDNGSGMAPEILERVFEERFSTKGPARGSGLGLSLCRSLVEKAGGTIEIFSQPGVGTEVQVKLPIALPGAEFA